MKKIWVVCVFLFVFLNVFTFHAREVDKNKLKNFVNMDLEFIDYQGPYDSTDTYQQIIGIGEFLAKNLINNKSNYYNKYYINRYIDSQDAKSSSDVFIISGRSSLDSILNLRRILTGYLMEGFSYSKESAELLAKAITIYNATYRGDLDYYSDSYIQPALEGLSKHNVGLSRVYSHWAGKTHIFIPLKRNILSGDIESDVDLEKIVTDKVVLSLLSENERVGTDFARDLTDIQDEIRDVDQEKIDIESVTLKNIDDELTETIDNLREELEKATDESEKEGIKKQIDDKIVERDALEDKAKGIKEAQKKLDGSQKKLDKQRDAVRNKIQESIDQENKNKNLPQPGKVSSPKVDKKLQLTETIDNLREELEKTTDESEKEGIKKQIDDKIVERDALEDKAKGIKEAQKKLDGLQEKLDKQRDTARDEVQKSGTEGIKNKNLPKPGKVSLSKRDEKLNSAAEALKRQLKKTTDPKITPNVINNQSSKRFTDKPLASKEQLNHSKDLGKSLENKTYRPVFLEVLNLNTNLGVLRFIDSDEGQLEGTSQYGIRRYGVYEREDDFVAIKLCSGIAKLQLLSKSENLKVESEADFELSRDSSLFVDSEMILVVVKDNNVWKLAKFSSKDLSKFILSEDEVLPFTSFTVNAGHVYLQDISKKIITLDLNTLKKVS
ncbi:hypothetical protein baBA2_000739 [Borrelia anserina]|uniref:Borrelia P83/100 antigen protein n=2 Tax=Borrelia anserina TaxID=143 RepID=W5SP58_BORAN|nr:P83/100 family protein [Borrelia anserina]AHH08712.1 Borrelia P83/100 antigen protein [Borrelia anserina BA2]APR65165.1 antigen, P83/100 [Borrelia anserina Es]UPA07089.1 hypothetical protein baBA2_000739 [Borrelia anserina]